MKYLGSLFYNERGELSVQVIVTIIIVLVVLFLLIMYISSRGAVMENIWSRGPFG